MTFNNITRKENFAPLYSNNLVMPFDFMDMTGEDAVSWIRMNISCLLSGISHVGGLAPFQFFSVFLLVVVLFPFFFTLHVCVTQNYMHI